MKRVLLRGPALTQSGYGVHCRQVARWLLSKNNIDLSVQALPWGITPWHLNTDDKLTFDIMQRCRPLEPIYDVTFQVQLPNEWDASLGKYNVGITAGVETDRCNPTWIPACSSMNQVIVPSSHTMSSFQHYGKIDNMSIIPESFPDNLLNPTDEILFDLDTDFNLLIFGQITGNNPENDRKNIYHTIRILCDVFADNPSVGIVLKTNSGKSTKIDRHITRSMLHQLINQVRRGPYPKFHFLHGALSDSEITSLYTHPNINALVSLTRGEGFGLPILEAAASGLPVIATNWSAYLDFMNKGKFISIDYSLAPIHSSRCDPNIFMADAQWAAPNEDDFKDKIKKFYKKHDKPNEWAKELSTIIKKEYSFDAIASTYDSNFDQILGT